MRTLLAAAVAALLLGPSAVVAQEAPATRELGKQPDVASQGTRAPTPTTTPTGSAALDAALEQTWNSAVDLQGAPIPGRSALAVPSGGPGAGAGGAACAALGGQPAPDGGCPTDATPPGPMVR